LPLAPARAGPPAGSPGQAPERGYRSIDGGGNHLDEPTLGAAHTQLRRLAPAAYDDGYAAMAGADRASPRAISSLVCRQDTPIANPLRTSDYLWQWGQF